MPALSRKAVQPLIRLALREDRAWHDRTSQRVIPSELRIGARVVANASGVLAGAQVAAWTFQTLDPSIRCVLKRQDGARLAKGRTILTVEGRARSIFAAERTALNFLGHLSGIATLTHEFVRRTKPSHVKILDTRKTLPGLRLLEKYAVRVGGGRNHRAHLAEAILIKTNHLRVLGRGAGDGGRAIAKAVRRAKRAYPRLLVGVEITNRRQMHAVLDARPDVILLDNMSLAQIRTAVRLRNTSHGPRSILPAIEVSGGTTLDNVRAIAATGADRISIGRLTHSAPALDVSLQVI